MTKLQIIKNLHKDKFIDDFVLWNLLSSKLKKSEIVKIDKTFRKYYKKASNNLDGNTINI